MADQLRLETMMAEYIIYRRFYFKSLTACSESYIGPYTKSHDKLAKAVNNWVIASSVARRVVSVINKTNQEIWINKAKSLTQQTLEMEVAKENPKEHIKERIRPVAEERLEMRLGIAPSLEKKLSRIKDLLSQKAKKSVSLEELLEAMADVFLEKHDPIQRAERLLARKVQSQKSEPIDGSVRQRKLPSKSIHAVNLRDKGQCVYVDSKGVRCSQSRWTQKHHLKLFSKGGNHNPDNIQTLCFHHHRKTHEDLSHASRVLHQRHQTSAR